MLSEEEKIEVCRQYAVEKVITINQDDFIVLRLMFHFALIVNPTRDGYEHRYCYKDLDVIRKALREYQSNGVLKYWHKDHCKGLSVACGNLLFAPGSNCVAGNEVGSVDWTV